MTEHISSILKRRVIVLSIDQARFLKTLNLTQRLEKYELMVVDSYYSHHNHPSCQSLVFTMDAVALDATTFVRPSTRVSSPPDVWNGILHWHKAT